MVAILVPLVGPDPPRGLVRLPGPDPADAADAGLDGLLPAHRGPARSDDYRERVKGLDHPRAVAAMLHYNYSLATLSVAKFRLVDRSIACRPARRSSSGWSCC